MPAPALGSPSPEHGQPRKRPLGRAALLVLLFLVCGWGLLVVAAGSARAHDESQEAPSSAAPEDAALGDEAGGHPGAGEPAGGPAVAPTEDRGPSPRADHHAGRTPHGHDRPARGPRPQQAPDPVTTLVAEPEPEPEPKSAAVPEPDPVPPAPTVDVPPDLVVVVTEPQAAPSPLPVPPSPAPPATGHTAAPPSEPPAPVADETLTGGSTSTVLPMPGVVPTPELILDPTNGEATVPVDPGSAPGTTAPAEAATVAQPAVPPLTEVAALPTEAPAPPTEDPAPPTEDPVPPSAVAAPGTAAPQAAQELSTATVVQRPATDGDASCRPPGGATASSQRVDSADRQRAISTRKSDVGGARPAATGPGTRSPLVVPAPTMAPTAAASPAPDTSPAPTKPVPPPAPQPAPVAPASPPAHNPGPAPAGQACTTVSVAGTGSGGGSTLDQLAIVEESLTATLSRAWTRLTSRLPARALGSTDQPGARPD